MSPLLPLKPGSGRPVGTRPRHLAMVLGLAILAIAQVVVLAARARALGPAPDFLTGGDDVSMLSFRLVDGAAVRLGDGRRTLLLAFDPECPHTRRVAPGWTDWLSTMDSGDMRILAIAPGPPGAAAAFAREMGWLVPVGTPDGLDDETVQMVAGRVPWVIAVDGEGVVVGEGHGSRLAEVAGAIWSGGGRVPGA